MRFSRVSDRATTPLPLTFESLYGTRRGWLKSWLTRKLQSAFDQADDIAQDTFLRVMVSETLSTIRDPRSFLCTIAKRVMVDLFRPETRWKNCASGDAGAYAGGGAPSPEERESQLETLTTPPTACWTGLNRKTREAFLLSQLDGLTHAARLRAKLGDFHQLREKIRGESSSSTACCLRLEVPGPRNTLASSNSPPSGAAFQPSHWYAVLSGERVSPQQEARWQQWHEQDQDNRVGLAAG